MRVFYQRGTAHGQGPLHDLEKRFKVCPHLLWKLGGEEPSQNLLVGQVGQRCRIQVVAVHELVEYVGAYHERVGDRNLHPLEVLTDGMTLDYLVHKCKTAPFAP